MKLDESDVDANAGVRERAESDRELGPEMMAQGWRVILGDNLMWLHAPSHRVLTVEGPCPRRTASYVTDSIPAYHSEPSDPATQGYLVLCRIHDEGGTPVAGDGFWVESYGEALRRAQEIRASILGERPIACEATSQLTFDDLLERT